MNADNARPGTQDVRDETPLSVWEALAREYEELTGAGNLDAEYRTHAAAYAAQQREARTRVRTGIENAAAEQEHAREERRFRDILIARLHQAGMTALCFSGGGIRSATFGLGVLQELARRSDPTRRGVQRPGILSQLDYLSTVSGGGYLGAWFSSLAYHKSGASHVIAELAATPNTKVDPEPPEVLHLRKFSAYLSPKLGVLSADTWTLIATVLRNILLNWFVLLPALVCILVIPQLVRAVIVFGGSDTARAVFRYASLGLAAAAIVYVVIDLPSAGDRRKSQRAFLLFNLLPLSISSLLISIYFGWSLKNWNYVPRISWKEFLAYPVLVLLIGFAIGLVFAFKKGELNLQRVVGAAICAVLTGVAVGAISRALADGLTGVLRDNPSLYTTLAFPAVFAILGASSVIFVGLTSRIATDDDREWWARAAAWLLIVPVTWLVFTGLVLHGPDMIQHIRYQIFGTGLLGSIASWLGFSRKTSSGHEKGVALIGRLAPAEKVREWAIQLIIPIFLAFLAVLVGSTSRYLNENIRELLVGWFPGAARASEVYSWAFLLACALVSAYVLGSFIDPNKFSLSAMYRARLIRAYLGASNPARRPSLFTGFDPADNLHMHDLRSEKPLHLVNMALNLVAGENLAWQQRKAESFTATRLHCGSLHLGYQPSNHYGHPKGMTLGGAITISGAAASPNMGYHSSPMLSVIMMLFNARLGTWLANPGLPGKGLWNKAGPTNAVRPFIDEACGLTNDKNAWVYLSDGGHFENLGLYEMVLRRCHAIIVVDASADPHFTFEDLGNAVRKVRIDLGIPIDFPQGTPMSVRSTNGRHCAKGIIRYSCIDNLAEDGVLVYIKPSLNGNEPPDVTHYSSQNASFPHETTADQWFNEPQLESYRRLGSHIIEEICTLTPTVSLQEFVEQVERYLWLPSATVASHFTRHAQAYDQLIERLRRDPNLSALDRTMFPNLKRDLGSELITLLRSLNPLNDQQRRSIFLFCNSLIQLMENVYLDLRLEDNQNDPDNAGWLKVFQNWTNSEHFKAAWKASSDTYGLPFRKFCARTFDLPFRE